MRAATCDSSRPMPAAHAPARRRTDGTVANQRQVRAMTQREQSLSPQVRPRIARDGKRIDVSCFGTSHRETRLNGLAREPRVMLDAAESLLLDGGDQLSVAEEGRGDVTVIRVDAEDEH